MCSPCLKCDLKDLLIFTLIFMLMLFAYIQPPSTQIFSNSLEKMIHEYRKPSLLHNILDARYAPSKDGKSIFFIESKESVNKVIGLTPRQSCSIESAALANPDYEVFVLFSYEVGFFNKTPLPIIDALLSYKNVNLAYFNIQEFAENSPLQLWFEKGKIFKSDHIVEHESDVLRILALWKYTGTYFDLDVVVKKPVSSIGSNFACIEKGGLINSAILNLDSTLGKSIAETSFDEVMNHFDGHSWAGNGPTILSDIVKKMCNTTNTAEMNRENCGGFKVLPTEDCYAISYPSWGMFFHENYVKQVQKATKDSFAVHFWNYLSHNTSLSTHSGAPYIKIAEEFCPKVLRASGDNF